MPPSATLRLTLADEAATARLASAIAGRSRAGDLIALTGALGSGKTSFARAFIQSLIPGEEVPSPTFTLVQTYDIGDDETGGGAVWHFDLYRLARPEDVWELGLDEALQAGISLIEWPERLGALLPGNRLELAFTHVADPGARIATLTGSADWTVRLAGLEADV